jgi:hypothetical protein
VIFTNIAPGIVLTFTKAFSFHIAPEVMLMLRKEASEKIWSESERLMSVDTDELLPVIAEQQYEIAIIGGCSGTKP